MFVILGENEYHVESLTHLIRASLQRNSKQASSWFKYVYLTCSLGRSVMK